MMVLVVAGLILFVISTIGMIVIYTIELHKFINLLGIFPNALADPVFSMYNYSL